MNYSDNNGIERQGAKPALKKMLGEVRWDGNICSNAGGYALVRKNHRLQAGQPIYMSQGNDV